MNKFKNLSIIITLLILTSCSQMFIDFSKSMESIFGMVGAPTFSLDSGSFDETQDIAITTETRGATLYYTDDGTEPTESNYTGSGYEKVTYKISKTMDIKAIAIKKEYKKSPVVTKSYIWGVVDPIISTLSGRNGITISTTTTGATIYFTTNGSTPTSSNSAGSGLNGISAYLPDGSVIVKAIAVKNGYTDSGVITQYFTILKEAPQIEVKENNNVILNGGSVSFGTVNPNITKDLTFTITNNGWNALNLTNIPKVTISGAGFSLKTDMSSSSIDSLQNDTYVVSFTHANMGTYTGTLTIANNSENAPSYSITLNVNCYPTTPPVSGITITQDGADIAMGTGVYYYGMVNIAGSGTTVQFSISNNSGSLLTLSATPMINIYGSADFSVTTQPISPISNTLSTIFGITFKPTTISSKSATVLIEMNGIMDSPFVFIVSGTGGEKVATPVFSLAEGEYETPQTTTMSCATTGAVVRYTTDGSNPTKTYGTLYNGEPINIDKNTTLKAIAYKEGNYVDSDIAQALYYIPPVFTMIDVPAGGFYIGGSSLVQLSVFKMSNTEVTYKLWKEVYGWALLNGYSMNAGLKGTSGSGSVYQPVTSVNWYDSVKWCNAYTEYSNATLGTSMTPVYYTDTLFATIYRSGQVDITNGMARWDANGYRLPTESEWEYSARYQDGTNWTPMDYLSGATANYNNDLASWEVGVFYQFSDGSNTGVTETANVGTKRANQLGIYDMSGNVWEWAWDWYDSPLPSGANPIGPEAGSSRLTRGGGWSASDYGCRVGDRSYVNPDYGYDYFGIGVRIARR